MIKNTSQQQTKMKCNYSVNSIGYANALKKGTVTSLKLPYCSKNVNNLKDTPQWQGKKQCIFTSFSYVVWTYQKLSYICSIIKKTLYNDWIWQLTS